MTKNNPPDIHTSPSSVARQSELKRLREESLYRHLRSQEQISPTRAVIDGREALLFAGNDYLGLASHPRVIAAATAALKRYGASAGAARLITGNSELYRRLEERVAAFKGKEAALVFPSGYMANLGFMAAAGPGDTIYMDRLNHASLYDGWRLSGAELKRYRHADTGHLATLIGPSASEAGSLIVTDGVFSMDGDLAPLPELRRLAATHGALLVVDDAHGTGVVGPAGRGIAAHYGLQADVEIGTFSKAAGSLGGFVAAGRELIDYLINKARPFIFTTGLPPATLAASREAFRLFEEEGWRRQRVLELAGRARGELAAAGFSIPEGFTPIIPLIVGEEEKALSLSELCLERGLFVPAVRTPAVPRGQARLRLTVSAAHSDDELAQAMDIMTASAGELGIL